MLRFSRACGCANNGVAADGPEPLAPAAGALTARTRIQDDTGLGQGSNLLGAFDLSSTPCAVVSAGERLSRLVLWLLGGIGLLAVILLIGINLFVQSQGTHQRIQQELSQRLGTPLHLRQISLTPGAG